MFVDIPRVAYGFPVCMVLAYRQVESDIQEVGGFHFAVDGDLESGFLESFGQEYSHAVRLAAVDAFEDVQLDVVSVQIDLFFVVLLCEGVQDVESQEFSYSAHCDVEQMVVSFLHSRGAFIEQQ